MPKGTVSLSPSIDSPGGSPGWQAITVRAVASRSQHAAHFAFCENLKPKRQRAEPENRGRGSVRVPDRRILGHRGSTYTGPHFAMNDLTNSRALCLTEELYSRSVLAFFSFSMMIRVI